MFLQGPPRGLPCGDNSSIAPGPGARSCGPHPAPKFLVTPPDPPAACLAAVSEEQCLYQIYIDELYGGLQRPSEDEKKK